MRSVFYLPSIGLLSIGLVLSMSGFAISAIFTRQSVTVDREVVLLCDLFDGLADERAEIAVMRAPAPGQRLSVDANVLASLASAHRLDWTASARNERVIVTRAGQLVPRPILLQALAAALQEQGFPAESDTVFDNEKLQILVPTNGPLTVAVEQMIADRRTNRFQAVVAAPAEERDAERFRITGRVVQTVEIPVANRVIGAGETVRDQDLFFQRVRVDIVNRTVLTDPSRIANRTARRTLTVGQPIRAGDLIAAYLVTKNALVDVRILSRGLSLVMQGKALEDGVQGDTVRILNTRSNKTIQGVVTAPNQATVFPPGSMAN